MQSSRRCCAPQHRRLWINDDDCLLLRPVDTELTRAQRRLLAATVAAAGGFTMVSDDLSLYGEDEWRLLEATRVSASTCPDSRRSQR